MHCSGNAYQREYYIILYCKCDTLQIIDHFSVQSTSLSAPQHTWDVLMFDQLITCDIIVSLRCVLALQYLYGIYVQLLNTFTLLNSAGNKDQSSSLQVQFLVGVATFKTHLSLVKETQIGEKEIPCFERIQIIVTRENYYPMETPPWFLAGILNLHWFIAKQWKG